MPSMEEEKTIMTTHNNNNRIEDDAVSVSKSSSKYLGKEKKNKKKKSKENDSSNKKRKHDDHHSKELEPTQSTNKVIINSNHENDDEETPSSKKTKKSKKNNSTYAYQQSEELSKVSQSVIDAFLKENSITLSLENDKENRADECRPVMEFKYLDLPKKLKKAVEKFPTPTPIQAVSWPLLLSGKDYVGIAATGSGKTLGFLVPGLVHIKNKKATQEYQESSSSNSKNYHSKKQQSSKPTVLVLTPTRELAMQIQEQAVEFGGTMKFKSVCVYGGVSKWEQKQSISSVEGVDIVVATPGRLLDLANEDNSVLDLSQVTYFVLDEADRMLDLGFEKEIQRIVAKLPSLKERQNIMFSATWPASIQKLSQQYLNNPARITVGSADLSANVNITQHVEVIDPKMKDRRLMDLLKTYHKSRKNRVLVFCLYKKEAARVEQFVNRNGFNAVGIHGDLSQQQRTQAINGFRDGSCPLLVATDVAARGLDIPNVEYVINYTYPLTTEEYCHRIGRTGRAGNKGVSHTLFTVHDKSHSGALINVLKQANQKVPDDLFKFGTTVKKKLDPNYGAFAKDVDLSVKGKKIVFESDEE